MRHLIVCCDGTWNTPEDRNVTNVRRLYNALNDEDEDRNAQVTYYQRGVGTAGRLLSRLIGGSFGVGLSRNVLDAYSWLATNYRSEDSIALFGFSRGAYTARSLAGMISACGLIDTTNMDESTTWKRIEQVYDKGYRQHQSGDRQWRNGLTFRYDPDDRAQIPLRFIGVWDTVGALGVPNYLGYLNMLDPWHRYGFLDVDLNPHIKHARHAVAMDERRTPYAPTLWAGPFGPDQDVKQVWFPGSHQDVGGGHAERGLSDRPLQWMLDEARDALGLGFDKTTVDQIRPDPLGPQHDDDRGVVGVIEPLVDPVLKPWFEVFLQPRPRAVPRIDPTAPDGNAVDESVYERQAHRPITFGRYRPDRVLHIGESVTVDVHASELWNETGLYLEAGSAYQFIAQGEWLDHDIASGPAGTTGLRRFNPLTEKLRLVGTLAGPAQTLFQRITGNRNADFIFSRREDDLPWMSLIGVIANDAKPVKGAFKDHERIPIGAGMRYQVVKSGYLYAFANDAWGFYFNNRGTVRLTVEKLSDGPEGHVS